uniref:Uncharacterized protein n=1 Tax=Macaca fascicularis TaxID=9541 RepID=A0A7N9CSH0_MACFA
MCWIIYMGLVVQQDYEQTLTLTLRQKHGSRVHVHNVQVCCICIHTPCWCAAPINSSCPLNQSFSSK